jgi:hypothetical protein
MPRRVPLPERVEGNAEPLDSAGENQTCPQDARPTLSDFGFGQISGE